MAVLVAGCTGGTAPGDGEPSANVSATVDARTEAFIQCLEERGWEAKVTADGGVLIEGMSDEQHEEFLKVESRCSKTVESIPPS
jgi:hypothetical protein